MKLTKKNINIKEEKDCKSRKLFLKNKDFKHSELVSFQFDLRIVC